MRFIDADEVFARLTPDVCITLIREAMIGLSTNEITQPLRNIVQIGEGRLFGVMPGVLGKGEYFGAKLLGVYPVPGSEARQRHHGMVALFDGESGKPVCIADAEAITTVRTAAATAVATEALARPDAETLAIFGHGTQAESHLKALTAIHAYERILVWGRSLERASVFARKQAEATGLAIEATESAEDAARASDVICTVTTSSVPVLLGKWVRPGTHVNAVGSSFAGPVEVDSDLVVASRYVVDSRKSALAQAAEFLNAKAAGLVNDDHIVAEIGEVLAGKVAGRRETSETTFYKSLGHIVQDLAAARYLSS